jgi:hypothetical protein
MRLHVLTGTIVLAVASLAAAERVYVHDEVGRLTEIRDVDLQNDPAHCGQPGHACGASETCQAGKCVACDPTVDFDCDGAPNATDNCPWKKNTDQHDGDLDGVGTACDNCPTEKNADQLNTDGAGDGGDACDPDDDNDFCLDPDDDKPKVDSSVVAWRVTDNCPDASRSVWGWDGFDADGDGIRNCMDKDDDEDGVIDAEDACPIDSGTELLACQRQPVSCPQTTIMDACQFGGCNQFLIQIVSVIYPPLILQPFTLRADVLVFLPSLSLGIEEMEAALLETGAGSGAARVSAAQAQAAGPIRIEMWSKDEEGRPKTLVARIAEYEPSQVQVREPIGEGALLVTPLEEGKAIAIQRAPMPAPEK